MTSRPSAVASAHESDANPRARTLLLLGNGGHASVVADAASRAGHTVVGCVDDREHPVAHPVETLAARANRCRWSGGQAGHTFQ